MDKIVVFDMDGTLADFYGVDGWLEDLRAENTRPYEVAAPLFSMVSLKRQIRQLKALGWVFEVVTWGSKQSTEEFLNRTESAKLNWLKRYGLLDEMANVQVVPYGVPKHQLASGILFDDNQEICSAWENAGGTAVNVSEHNLLAALKELTRI